MKKALHVLLADDDKDDRFFFRKALKQISIPTHLTTVEDGQKLLDFLNSNREQLPDVIFLDLNMPRLNGGESLSEIKNDEKLKQIPVVIYSTAFHEEEADVLYRNGAHYYLKKCNITELPAAIIQILTFLEKNPEQPSRADFIVSLQEA